MQARLTGLPLHSIGEPSDVEVLYVELINRARADANVEALRLASSTDPDVVAALDFFNVDLALFQSQMAALASPLPPLVIDATLGAVADLHSQDMFENSFQGHVSSANPPPPFPPNATLGQRLAALGYSGAASENVFAFAESGEHGHAGFELDWGNGPGGMQSPPGHRLALHNADRNIIGVGVVLGTNGSGGTTVGPQVVTQDLGRRSQAFVTGVAIFDLDGDGFYDSGEAIGGVDVNVAGANFEARTTASGAYAVPVPGNGTFAVTFSANGMSDVVGSAVITSSANAKLDLVLPYTPPNVSGSATIGVLVPSRYTLTAVPAATGYAVEVTRLQTGTLTEGAEATERRILITSVGGYDVIQSGLVNSGGFAFHLAHPTGVATEVVEFDADFAVLSNSNLSFRHRLGLATAAQVARVQISTNGGSSWSTLFTRGGSGGSGDSTWLSQSTALSAFEGERARLRFTYSFSGGSFFSQTGTNAGWLLDDIVISNVEAVLGTEALSLGASTGFDYRPTALGTYSMRGRALNGSRSFPLGPAFELTVVAGVSAVPLFGTVSFAACALLLLGAAQWARRSARRVPWLLGRSS